MKNLLRLTFLGFVFLVSACATLDKDECLNADWELIGYEDGVKGYSAQRIGEHRKACSKHGVTPDLEKYTKGRERGLKVYCTPQNGFKVGQNSSVYRDVCPADMDAEFKKAFEYGGRIRAHRVEIGRFERDIAESREAIQVLQEEMDLNEALIVRGARGPVERARLIRRNRELRELIAREEDRIARSVHEIEQLKLLVDELFDKSPYK